MFREFQLRHGLEPISSDLEEAIINCSDYRKFIVLLNEAFPLIMIQKEFFSNVKDLNQFGLNDPVLVKKGLHAFRRWAAQLAHEKRCIDNVYYNYKGFVTYTFDDEEIRLKALKEFQDVPYSVNKQSSNIVTQNLNKLSTLYNCHLSFMYKILGFISHTETPEIVMKYNNNTFAQRVYNKPDDNDNQKLYHVDTFFPAIKWWWFPEEVKASEGAFWYAENSCQVTDSMLDWLYIESIKCIENSYDEWRGKDHKEGSFRASMEEIENMGFNPTPLAVPANTLVIGNVAGFHRRGDTIRSIVRNALHGSIRLDNPFYF